MNLITREQLNLICPHTPVALLPVLPELFNSICPRYKLDTKDEFHEFLAQLAVESGEFTRLVENLNYSAERLHQVFRKYFPTLESAKKFERKVEAIANKVYGGRVDLGNTQHGDGWLFRGSGPIQMTGRGIITRFCLYVEKTFGFKHTPEEMAQLIRTDWRWGIESACWVFCIEKSLLDEAEADDVLTVSKRINGGTNGLNERLHYTKLAEKYIV